jgi:hypothetical protein
MPRDGFQALRIHRLPRNKYLRYKEKYPFHELSGLYWKNSQFN